MTVKVIIYIFIADGLAVPLCKHELCGKKVKKCKNIKIQFLENNWIEAIFGK
jgi:hypothetical protein